MSIYIMGMEMPRDCWHCHFADPESGECLVDQKPHGDWEEPENCPLIPVPPHGRLIDADAMCEGLVNNHPVVIYARCAPTILPVDKEAPT